MATEHEIGRDQSLGWVQPSSCRYYPSGSWGSWCEKSMPASGSPAMSSRDCIKSYYAQLPDHGSEQLRELDEDNWVRASESTEDICDKNSSPERDMGRTAENVSDNMEASDSEAEEFGESEIKRKCSGLTNLGNTCFMNSVLQCLTYTVPLANKILSSRHNITCKSQEFCAMCAMESHIKSVLAASGSTVSPSFLAHNLDQISGSFLPGQQQDAHEFLLFFLESIQENSKVHRSCGTQDCQTKGLVSELFMGQMRSQVKCKACSHCSDSFDEFLGLNLDIEHCSSLKEALSSFLAVEDLQEEVKVHCPSCKIPADRSKQLNFKRSPPVLVIQLKRYMASEIFPTKIEKDIKYDLSLDLTPFVIEDATEPIQELDWKYKLYAVLVHSGWSTSSGHYYCFVQTSPGIWHCMNDSLVSRVRERTVLDQEAYLLFYVREGIKETLHLEQAEPIGLEKESARDPQTQTSEISNKYMCDSLMKDKPACGKHKQLDTDVNNPATSCRVPPSKHSGSSEQEHVDIVVANVANNEEDPHGNAKKAVEKILSSTSSLEQQALKRSVSGVSVVANVANNEEDPHGNAKKAVEKNLSSTSRLEQQALKRSVSGVSVP
ncbi:hypothetical protein KP509_35G006100 [Ceratopteris richardii]|uniref:Ubiquitin carboxyl-terminal hydrolase n=1 Tax=Ceratopteris richardii TaxID=49495 RepID=A0A8T2QE68_CERRI|nr:hypothetical protein KP509_35G006100 [Ceratopteris richardii]